MPLDKPAAKRLKERMRVANKEGELDALAIERFTPPPAEVDPRLKTIYGIFNAVDPLEALPRGLAFNPQKFDVPDDINAFMDDVVEAFPKEFEEFTRGTQKLSDIQERAEAQLFNTTTSDIRELRALKAEDMTRAAFTLVNMATEVKKVAQRAASPSGSEQDVALLRTLMDDFVLLQMHVKGLQTETARTLSAMRITKQTTAAATRQVSEVVREFGGMGHNKRIAAMIAQMEDPAQMGRVIGEAHRATAFDMFIEIWKNALLTNPATHIINTSTALAATYMRAPEYATAYLVGNIRRLIAPQSEQGIFAREVLAYMTDWDAYRIATQRAWSGLRRGQASDLTQKFETGSRSRPSVTAQNIRELPLLQLAPKFVDALFGSGTWTQRGFDVVANWVVRGSTRVIMTADEFVKGLTWSAEMRRIATRTAILEGDPTDLAKRVDELLIDHQQLMPGAANEAVTIGKTNTFQDELGTGGQAISKILNREPVNFPDAIGQGLLALIFPFYKTPVNLFKYAARHSVLAAAMPSVWADVAAGGRRLDMAVANVVVGSSFAYGMFSWAMGGMVTGQGPLGFKNRKPLEELGWQEYSIIFSKDSPLGRLAGWEHDKVVSYKRADPFSQILGMVADYNDIAGYATGEEREKITVAILVAIHRNLLSRTYLEGMGRMSKALEAMAMGNTEYMENFFANSAASLRVPPGVRWLMQRFEDEPRVRRVIRSDADAEFTVEDRMNPPDTIDALSHDVIVFAETIMNAIRRREGSTDLAPRLTFFGKEIERAHGWLWDTIPFYTKDLKFDTAALEKIGVDPLRWTGTPAQQMGPGNFIRFISIVGPEGEFVRLGWSPGHHPDKVAGVKLTAHEAAIYAKTVNEIRPDGGLMMVNDVDEGPVMVMEYDGLNMKEAMVELMQTEYYFSAPDESDMVNSKTDMINRIVGYYRHRVNFDRDINLGGADAVLDAVSPRFQRRLLQMRDFRGEEIE